MPVFLLIRHGETDTLSRILAGRAPGTALNARGQAQAAQLAERLAGAGIRRIVSSPLERARQTAEPLARRLGLAVEIAEELNELDFGSWTGRTFEDLRATVPWQRYNRFRSTTRMADGELIGQVQARAISLMVRLAAEFPDETIALFSHGDVIRAVVAHFAGMPLDFLHRIEISPASVTTVRVDPDWAVVMSMNVT